MSAVQVLMTNGGRAGSATIADKPSAGARCACDSGSSWVSRSSRHRFRYDSDALYVPDETAVGLQSDESIVARLSLLQ